MIKSKRRINKRELVEGSRTDRAPSYWENQPWFIRLRQAYGLAKAIEMGLDAKRKSPHTWDGEDARWPASHRSVVVWAETSFEELWMNA
ncbi:hypothetical protein K59PH2_LOCUS10 [Klebsiella phage vB_Kpl_K59PH2]|uniref:Uncharacterized protein n=1 Tax=Klebsiella phage vB_Kpl_K59PH2 TaxID=3071671 RepID=A0AAD2JTE1_9CAUD|nr:hypothetical protein K59PH2_LOCUS10 [Klebsiella phage vB_Kpl_K59PH2]